MSGDVHVRFCERPGVRFPRATHLVIALERKEDAHRVVEVLPKRFERFGLTLHPSKTRLRYFRRPDRDDDNGSGPGTFDLLGFTHYWGRTRRGKWVVKKRTAKDRFSRSLHRIAEWCRSNRHQPVGQQHDKLSEKMRGHYAYFGVTFNIGALERFYWEVVGIWRKWLGRRSRACYRTWAWMYRLLRRLPLPRPRIVRRYDAQLRLPAGAAHAPVT